MNHWTLDFFLERIAEMPDVEALQEIDLRIKRIFEQRGDITQNRKASEWTEADHLKLAGLRQDELTLRQERHLIVMRMDRRKWSKAVKALWGDEGVERVLVWFEVNGEPDTKQLPLK